VQKKKRTKPKGKDAEMQLHTTHPCLSTQITATQEKYPAGLPPSPPAISAHEKNTALGSSTLLISKFRSPPPPPPQKNVGNLPVGLPSGAIPFLASFDSIKIRLASSKSTLRRLMMRNISFLLATSRPARESPSATLPARENASELYEFFLWC
jgi:hypothetical protein